MRERLEAKPTHAAGAVEVASHSKEVAFMLRVRAHLADPKMWLQNGQYWSHEFSQAVRRGLYIPIEETPSCLIGTALLLQGMVGGHEYSWGEKLVRDSMGFFTFQQLYQWNDTCTHAELMARLDAAIVKLQRPEEESCTSL
jgi:hypothetical protein